MRYVLRTALITLLVTLAVLGAWTRLRGAQSPAARAATNLQVPSYCVPPELASLEDMLARTSDPAARRALQAKEQAARQLAEDCAANAAAHPPAQKPSNAGPLPTSMPVAAPTLPDGIQHAELVPSADFLPTQDGNNAWAGMLNGRHVEVYAGAANQPDDSWQQEHPEWAAQPQLHLQGALRIVPDANPDAAALYATPGRHGTLQLIGACNGQLILQALDGTTWAFDLTSDSYSGKPASCP